MANIQHTNCPLCNSKNLSHIFTSKDYYVTKTDFPIYICKDCQFKFTNNIPNIYEIGKYYKSEEYLSHNHKKKSLFDYLYFIVKNYNLKMKYNQIKKYMNDCRMYIDYGCGTGEFLQYIKNKGFNTIGYESDEDARKFAIKQNKLLIHKPEQIHELDDNFVDVWSMWHVLEHIHDLKDFLAIMQQKITKNGYAIIAVPISNSYDAELYKKYWAAYDVPRHLYHFTEKHIVNLFQEFNFKLINTFPLKFDSYYVSLLSEKYKTGKTNYVKGILNGYKSNTLAKKTNQYSSVTFIFQKQ